MDNTNYFSAVVKILENPKQKFFKKKIPIITMKVEVPQNRNSQIILLLFFGNLAYDIKKYYQINDYILIEGYLSIRNRIFSSSTKNSKKMLITVLKIYPFLLKSIRTNPKI